MSDKIGKISAVGGRGKQRERAAPIKDEKPIEVVGGRGKQRAAVPVR